MRSRNFAKPVLAAFLSFLIILILALIVLSPAALEQASKVRGVNWGLLSNIGQTYGAVSALLSALALGGVVASLFYQARDVRSAAEQASRTFHFDLLKMEMNDPFYAGILRSPGGEPDDYDSLRKHNFIHMWVTYWEARYNLRESSDQEVRYIAANELLNSIEGRRYWSHVRAIKLAGYRGRLARFTRIVDDEYSKAINHSIRTPEAPETSSADYHPRTPLDKSRIRSIAATCVTGAAIIIAALITRWRIIRRP